MRSIIIILLIVILFWYLLLSCSAERPIPVTRGYLTVKESDQKSYGVWAIDWVDNRGYIFTQFSKQNIPSGVSLYVLLRNNKARQVKLEYLTVKKAEEKYDSNNDITYWLVIWTDEGGVEYFEFSRVLDVREGTGYYVLLQR